MKCARCNGTGMLTNHMTVTCFYCNGTGTVDPKNPRNECEHGSLRYKSPICDRDDEIKELKAQLETYCRDKEKE